MGSPLSKGILKNIKNGPIDLSNLSLWSSLLLSQTISIALEPTFHISFFGPIRLRCPYHVTTCNLVHRSEMTNTQIGHMRPFCMLAACPPRRSRKRRFSVIPVFRIDVHRFEARDRKLSCARARCRRRTQRGASDRNRADRFRQWRNYFSRGPDDPSTNTRMWDAGSRQRRHRILQQRSAAPLPGRVDGIFFSNPPVELRSSARATPTRLRFAAATTEYPSVSR